MQISPEFSTLTLPAAAGSAQTHSQVADVVYQSLTITAMLLLLCTLWVF